MFLSSGPDSDVGVDVVEGFVFKSFEETVWSSLEYLSKFSVSACDSVIPPVHLSRTYTRADSDVVNFHLSSLSWGKHVSGCGAML